MKNKVVPNFDNYCHNCVVYPLYYKHEYVTSDKCACHCHNKKLPDPGEVWGVERRS